MIAAYGWSAAVLLPLLAALAAVVRRRERATAREHRHLTRKGTSR